MLLGTSPGTVSGVVTDGTIPLGDVTVTTTVNGQEVTTGTPTTGAVGTFVLSDLPTPATYVLTFTADGYATRTVVVGLGPGQNLSTPAVATGRRHRHRHRPTGRRGRQRRWAVPRSPSAAP